MIYKSGYHSLHLTMKRLVLLTLFLYLFSVNVHADEPTGIRFFSGSWQQLLAEATRQNKPLFVDVYTTWCPPCRRMAREAFPDAAVGATFNKQFISYQLNAEVGEGVELAKRFAVQSYPTALYLLPTGELIHRSVGYGGVKSMITQAGLVLSMPAFRRLARRKRASGNDLRPIDKLPNQSDTTRSDLLPN